MSLNHLGKSQWNLEQFGQSWDSFQHLVDNSPPFSQLTGGLGQVSGQLSTRWNQHPGPHLLCYGCVGLLPPILFIPDLELPGPCWYTLFSSVRQGRGRRAWPCPSAVQGKEGLEWRGSAITAAPLGSAGGSGARLSTEHKPLSVHGSGFYSFFSFLFDIILLHRQKAERIPVLGSL